MNFADSRYIEQEMNKNNFQKTQNISESDVIIMNACSVRKHAEDRALGWLSSIQDKKKLIISVGCLSKHIPQKLKAVGADIAKLKFDIKDILKIDIKNPSTSYNFQIEAEIPIVRGCDRFCSYCIVPYLRGPVISIDPEEIFREIEYLSGNNVKIITLLGQNINRYNYKGYDFADLLKDLSHYRVFGFSFLTSHPSDMSDKIIDAMSGNKKILSFLHLPFQSGSDKVLKNMGRGYTIKHYINLINKVRDKIPRIRISTDIMVGLPNESEEDFNKTLDIVRKIRFNEAFMFAHSKREGTLDNLKKSIPLKIKKERLSELIKVQRKISRELKKNKINSIYKVLILKKAPRGNNSYISKSRDNQIIIIEGNYEVGDIIKIKIEKLSGGTLIGKSVS